MGSGMKNFCVEVEGLMNMDVNELWPNGDAPKNPTAADVVKVVEENGSLYRFVQDWGVLDVLEVSVEGETVDLR